MLKAKNAGIKTFGTKTDNSNIFKDKVDILNKKKQLLKPKVLLQSEKRKKAQDNGYCEGFASMKVHVTCLKFADIKIHSATVGKLSQIATIGCNNNDIPNPVQNTEDIAQCKAKIVVSCHV